MSIHSSLRIRQAQILLPDGDVLVGDVLIQNGSIVQVCIDLSAEAIDTDIDATGLTLLPGVIDFDA
ncbi:hypothetical protein ACN4EK_19635 [Pantanalinema rosaneae CENA516]|uniref:hypothetical protein n=1 Tax=Pantanalinema rosaneae TaxID=1620701 RepID=UPI003D7011B4